MRLRRRRVTGKLVDGINLVMEQPLEISSFQFVWWPHRGRCAGWMKRESPGIDCIAAILFGWQQWSGPGDHRRVCRPWWPGSKPAFGWVLSTAQVVNQAG